MGGIPEDLCGFLEGMPLPAVMLDPVQIQQVVLNLVRNAVEAMETVEKRELTISTCPVGDTIETSVADTGPTFSATGAAPAPLPKSFKPVPAISRDVVFSKALVICPRDPRTTRYRLLSI